VFGHRCRQQDPADGGDHFGWQRSERGTGSGEIIRSKGYILTNNPVISVAANGGQVSVLFSDGHSAPATITAAIPGPTWESDDHRSCGGQLPQLGARDLEQNGAWRTAGEGWVVDRQLPFDRGETPMFLVTQHRNLRPFLQLVDVIRCAARAIS
jgi:hypothetical protein